MMSSLLSGKNRIKLAVAKNGGAEATIRDGQKNTIGRTFSCGLRVHTDLTSPEIAQVRAYFLNTRHSFGVVPSG